MLFSRFFKSAWRAVVASALGLICSASLLGQHALSGDFYYQNFIDLGNGLPSGWSVRTGATATALGTAGVFNPARVDWANTAGAWKNYASAAGYNPAEGETATGNRALGIRQTGTFGDPGASANFNFSSVGVRITAISFSAQLLSVQTRSTTWLLQYGIGASPSSWTTIATYSDPGVFGHVTVNATGFGTALDNQANAWLRVVALAASTGSGSRDSFGIDDVILMLEPAPSGGVAPTIDTQPVAQTVNEGSLAQFTVAASGTAPLSYQWKKGVNDVVNSPTISGAQSATLTINPTAAGDAGNYSVVITNGAGSVTSDVVALTVNPAPAVLPTITQQPVSLARNEGGSATFTVAANGTAPLSYQWRKGGVNLTNGARISGATTASLTVSQLEVGDAGNYDVVVSNAAGSTPSALATLTVNVVELYWDLSAANFSQDWSNNGLITANDNWSNVLSLRGYLGQGLTGSTGTDPQTIVSPSQEDNDLDVIANQNNPNGLTSGGVAEFDGASITNRTIALQGSGTADAPHLVLHLDASGRSDLTVSYKLRDLDGSTDNAAQPVALQYRLGETGDYINLDEAFVADATTGPSQATQETLVSFILPAALNNQSKIQLRWITSNAVGNDEWVGIDDIVVTSQPDNVPRVFLKQSNNSTVVSETSPSTDTYTVRLNTTPAGPVTIRALADAQTQVSADGVTFGAFADLTFTNTTAQTITVRAIDDATNEAAVHFSTITHAVTASGDPGYPVTFSIPALTAGVQDNDGGTGITRIHAVQGSSAASPLVNYAVTISGVVTGFVHNSTGTRDGFFVQEEDTETDSDPLTSEGVFVFVGASSPQAATVGTLAVGNVVVVSGAVTEFNGLTEVTGVSAITVNGSTALPTAATVTLPVASTTYLERFEGMRVVLPQKLTVTDNYTLGQYGEVVLSNGRLPQPTNIAAPGAPAQAQLAANRLNQIVLDDATSRTYANPTPYVFDEDGIDVAAGTTLRAGDTTTNASGVLTYQFGNYAIQPTVAPVFVRENPRPAPPVVSGSLKVATGNVLNLFNGDGAGGGFPTARGASDSAEYQRQRAKIVAGILAIGPDIMGLVEMENDRITNGLPDSYGPTSAVADLVNALNAAAPAGTTYAYVNAAAVDIVTDLIHSVFIYRTQTVELVGAPAMLSSPYFNNHARNPLAQTFREKATGGVLTVCVNHFRAKASVSSMSDGISPNPNIDQGDGQGTNNYLRRKEAEAVAQWLATDPTSSGDPDFLIIGDLNAYAKEDPIVALQNAGYVNLTERFEGTGGYSYSFDGAFGHLDHALATASLNAQVVGTATWHANSDEPIYYDYNTENKAAAQLAINVGTPFRYSDHDPVVIGLNLTAAPKIVTQPVAQTTTVGTSVTLSVVATGTPAPGYQWRKGGQPIGGATSASFTLAQPVVGDSGSYDVVVSNSAGSVTSNAVLLTVNKGTATVALANLAQTYDGTARVVTATTTPVGLNVVITYAGSNSAPVNAGSYAVVATVEDANYLGTASGTLVVDKATATVALTNLTQVYSGAPKSPTVTTTPAGLATAITFDGDSAAPTNVGSYAVNVVVTDPNHIGGASGTFQITPAPTPVVLSNLTRTYDGTPKAATVTTTPAGVAVAVTYNGAGTAPTAAGSYAVVATVTDSNRTGGATGTLIIAKAPATIVLHGLTQAYDGQPKVVTATTSPVGLPVGLTYNGSSTPPVAPGAYAIVATVTDPNYAGTASDTLLVGVTALVRRAPSINGGVDGSVQVLVPESFALNSNAWVSGDILVPGSPTVRLNGKPTFGGVIDGSGAAAPSDYQVTLNGGAVLRKLVRRTDPLALPMVLPPPAPTGTRDVVVNAPGQPIGDVATLRHLTLNGNAGTVELPPGSYGNVIVNGSGGLVLGVAGATNPSTYNLRSLTLNGNARLRIVGPVTLTLGQGVALNGAVGDPAHPEWLTLRVASGGVTLNGNSSLHGFLIAPNGTVTINGSATLHGGVTADRLTINGNGQLDGVTP